MRAAEEVERARWAIRLPESRLPFSPRRPVGHTRFFHDWTSHKIRNGQELLGLTGCPEESASRQEVKTHTKVKVFAIKTRS
jgi:hypothetical protein